MSLSTAFEPTAVSIATNPVIEIEGVAVRYRSPQEKILSVKEYAIRWVRREIRYNDFWALQDIDLKVSPGEVLGIVGPNGAGKSTLLKVISRVLKPTKGRVRIRGRVSPLLELGAGFNGELTGRENIYLNSAILGFSKRDIDTRFDRIVEFAGLKDFIDASVRTYSTGMVARLGFSVATDVQPEILIVDEILGVGDTEFQTKSFERIQSFQASGSTILLVTHSMNRVREMCSRAIWLDRGEIKIIGSAEDVVGQYLELTKKKEAHRLAKARQKVKETPAEQQAADQTQEQKIKRWGSQKLEITATRLLDAGGEEQGIFQTGQPFRMQIDYLAHQDIESPVFGIAVYHNDGTHVTGPNTAQFGLQLPTVKGKGMVTYLIPELPLLEGLYHLSVAVVNQDDTETFDFHGRAYPFRVLNTNDELEKQGLVTLKGIWEFDGK